ncbi:MAG: hypothetical protein ACK4ZJ_17075 [Allorhizobium sp.]
MAIRMLMPYVMFAIATVVWDAAPSQPFQRHPLLMMLCVIMLYTLLVVRVRCLPARVPCAQVALLRRQ